MAVELSNTRGTVKEVVQELGIDPSRLSKWRSRTHSSEQVPAVLSQEQLEIRRLQRELGEQELLASIEQVPPRQPQNSRQASGAGIVASHPRVARVRRKVSVKSIVRQKYRVQTTDSNHLHTLAENHLNREFAAPGQL